MKINKLDNFGRGITFIDNKITFVNGALPNEDVELNNIKENKKFNEALAGNITNYNPNRILPKCPYYDLCGGCNMMHVNLDYEEEFKLNKIKELFIKYVGIDVPVKLIKCDSELFYRNKITLKVKNGEYGYFNQNTHNFVKIDTCLIVSNAINNFLKTNTIKMGDGELVIRSNYQDNILISITSSNKIEIDYNNIPNNVIGIVINDKTVYKDNFIYDCIGDMRYKISYNSFFQVNNYVASCIFDILRSNLKGKNLLDLYCGVGTLGLALSNNFTNIYGIEKVENAILNARDNASLNGIKNTKFYVGDTGDVLPSINTTFDTVIVDPPRSGLNKKTIDEILKINPECLAYVSCDPMTLVRDLKVLKEFYNIKKVNALNMFPNTYHCETICVLERR